MNIRAIRYSIVDGAEGAIHMTSTGRKVRQILIPAKARAFENGMFNAGYTYDNEMLYQDDMWLAFQKEKQNAIQQNHREVPIKTRKNLSPYSKR